MQYRAPRNRQLVLDALQRAGRTDLIGTEPKCLIGPERRGGGPRSGGQHGGGAKVGAGAARGRAGGGSDSRAGGRAGKAAGRATSKSAPAKKHRS